VIITHVDFDVKSNYMMYSSCAAGGICCVNCTSD